ncbi:hypothetical protein EXE10_20995, partial [Acinetobacter sp. WCHAc060033]|uniref:hypothetical protein n=1 Tax=Acinetobacter sp. WCHAc060033 TaxID=2518624 RepID=UPI001022CD2A
MINFSEKDQAFYDSDLNYSDPPSDLIEIDEQQHTDLLSKLNEGCYIFSDLTTSEKKPSAFHKWIKGAWVDDRTEDEKREYYLSRLPSLTRYQFLRCLLENGFKSSDIEAQILTIEDEMKRELALLGFKEATSFVRTDDSIVAMQSALGFSDEQVDRLWEYAM